MQYDEWTEGKDSPKRRTYWIQLNRPQTANPHRPRFVPAKTTHGLMTLPFDPPEANRTTSNASGFAVAEVDPPGFTLNFPNRAPARYDLPVFDDASGLTKQICLTPFAVCADATVIGGYLCLLYIAEGECCCP